MLQEIRDIKLQRQENNIFNVHKNHPKGTDEGNDLDDTHSIHNSTSSHLPHDKPNTLKHRAPNPNHAPNIDDNAFAQQKQAPYELWSTSPPKSLSSSSSDKDSMDDNIDCAKYVWIKTGLPWKRVGRGDGELEMEGEWETRGGTKEERPGPSSGAVTKLSGPELDSEVGHH